MTETFLNEMSLVEREQLLKLAKAAKLDRKSFEVSKIAHVQPRDHQPLSFAQQRLWFLTQLEGASEAYHISRALRLEGDLDRAALRSALDRIVLRHEALRTTFVQLEGETVQRVLPEEEGRFHLVEQDLLGRADAREALDRMVAREAGVPFDLGQGPLIRGLLLRLAEEEHVLVITMHHIVSDGWSMNVLVGELSALYGAFRKGEADPLPPLEVQYIDYAAWQRQWVTGEVLQRQADYWKAALEGVPALLEIPKDHGRPAHQDFEGALVDFELDPELTKGIKALSLRHGVTPFMTLLAAWTVLLSRLSGQEDLVVGTPVANRGRAEIEGLIGFFVNTLALRLDLSGTPTVGELLGRVKARALSAQHHQDIPFEQVVEIAHPVRSLAHSPLFQVMFAWQSGPEDSLDFPGLSLTPLSSSRKINAKFDLTLTLQEKDGTISGDLEYATALFDRPTIERYLGYLRTLVAGMVEDEARTIDRLPLLTAGEGHQLLVEWNATEAEYPTDACVHELFEAQAAMTPEAIALQQMMRGIHF